jgi:hypothetical protein
MDAASTDFDALFVEYMQLVDRYTTLQKELAEHLRAGNIALASARKSMGTSRLSTTLIPSTVIASRVLCVNSGQSSKDKSVSNACSFSVRERSVEDMTNAYVRDEEFDDAQDSDVEPSVVAQRSHDPRKWFGVLVDRGVSECRSQYVSAVDRIAELASVSIRMNAIQITLEASSRS